MHTCAGPSTTRVHIYTQVDTHGWMHCSTHVSAFIPSCGAHTPTHTFTGMHLPCTTMHHRPYCMCVKHPQGCTAGVSTCPHTCTRTPTQCVHTAGCSHALIGAHTHTRSSTARTHSCYCCSVSRSCPILHEPMDCSTPGFPVLHHLPEFAQTHVV